MKAGSILAALIAILVGAFAAVLLTGVFMIPLSGLVHRGSDAPLMWTLRAIIFVIVVLLVFREMSEKFGPQDE